MPTLPTYWAKLLNHYEQNSYFKNGLTLPFIIGSRSIIEPNEPLESIKDFFENVKLTGIYLNVIKCDGIGEYVFRIGDIDDINIYDTKGLLIIPDNIFETYIEVDEIINQLDNEYRSYIEQGTFSKNGGSWGNYSKKELKEILEVVGIENI
ncbi:hypothetical protein [Sphingobacterium sp. 2149]|uniref:hypothetical protein n=1 Tax=Sphingobacterium sp. 2149 TaxID=2817763 RepID=UPI0028546B90|nr:hypothetical protein [Sphingobacterium sp. 2149]MDR6735494.1 hypothetical protein [Sphingobacterium sp. 2149]